MKKKTSTSKKALNKKVAKGKKSPVKGGGGQSKQLAGKLQIWIQIVEYKRSPNIKTKKIAIIF